MKILISSIALLILSACCDCNNPASASNNAPIVEELRITGPFPLELGRSRSIVVIATDPDGDALTYIWSADVGYFGKNSTDQPENTYGSSTAGEFSITCTASDGMATASKSITVSVSE